MADTFPVEWKRIFRSLSISMTVAIIAPVTLLLGIRYIASGFDCAKTFEHMSLPVFLLILACVPVFSVSFSLVIALYFRLATVTISNEEICGRSFWGLKNRIPLTDIAKLTPFSNNGIDAIVVNSRYHGQIYISDKTQRLPELLTIPNQYLPESEKTVPSRTSRVMTTTSRHPVSMIFRGSNINPVIDVCHRWQRVMR